MDLLLIVRDALASALIGTLLAARDAHAAGRTVAVLVTGEALAAAARRHLRAGRASSPANRMRLGLADRGSKELGVPLLAKGEGRQLDPKALLVATAAADGLTRLRVSHLVGAPRPRGAARRARALDRPGLARLLAEAGKVVGSL